MSTQEMQVPQTWTGTTGSKRAAAAALVVAALAVGAVVGRSTAPTAQVREAVPATAMTDVGTRSVGDTARALEHRAFAQTAVLATTGELSLGDARRAEMFAAMNDLSPVPAADPSDGWAAYAVEHQAMNQLVQQQAG